MPSIRMLSIRTNTMAIVLGGVLASGPALADGWPASVAGNWSVIGNQATGTLSITQYAGAAGSQCKPIRGTIYGVDVVEGFYCPSSGRISFLRYVQRTTTPMQYWSGNLSQDGTPLRIGGSFAVFAHNNVLGTTGGSLGEYNFSATK